MPTPFPGMNPYLEEPKNWPIFQHQFITTLHDALQQVFIDKKYQKYQQSILERTYETQKELFLEIRLNSHDGRLVTRLELISPSNRTNPDGSKAYYQCRQEALTQNANLIELEFVIQGNSILDVDLPTLTERQYVCCLTRSNKKELHGIMLDKRLPRIRLPFLAEDRDVVLDLQSMLNRVYDRNFDGQIDYSKDPAVPLSDQDRNWINRTLIEKGLR